MNLKIVFKTELGAGFNIDAVNSIVNYNARTGNYPDCLSENDWVRFEKEYVKPFRESTDENELKQIETMDVQRENDIQELCKQVLETPTEFYDNPNGAYESSCPFCEAIEYRGGHSSGIHSNMNELNHNSNCAYLIAKDLSTK